MARIPMVSSFKKTPEGEYVFRIYDVKYDETFGTLELNMVDATGQKHLERYYLKDQNDQPNEKALASFSYLAKAAMDDFEMDDVDPDDLINHYIRCEVVHRTGEGKDGKTKTYVNLTNIATEYGFDKDPIPDALTIGRKPAAKPQPEAEAEDEFDLDALLKG